MEGSQENFHLSLLVLVLERLLSKTIVICSRSEVELGLCFLLAFLQYEDPNSER